MSGKANTKIDPNFKVVADNRRARFDYEILETLDAGIVLEGTEVKALRLGKANLSDSYASPENGEIFLINCYIPEYEKANRFNHAPRRARKLLVKRREANKLWGAVNKQGMTLVPLKLYFNERGIAKVQLAVAKGKKVHDKRQTDRDRSWQRDKARLMREKG